MTAAKTPNKAILRQPQNCDTAWRSLLVSQYHHSLIEDTTRDRIGFLRLVFDIILVYCIARSYANHEYTEPHKLTMPSLGLGIVTSVAIVNRRIAQVWCYNNQTVLNSKLPISIPPALYLYISTMYVAGVSKVRKFVIYSSFSMSIR